ncbi:MAG: glycerophosphodiester phosphodiesterase [Flavobacterium sp.]|nr:glycerophosphodiester phosphodiesterase [Flavobacterium sp.]
MLKIGHRGAKGHAPENTLISFQKAIELGVDGIELDVHLTSDNHVVVIHDESVDRTTSGTGLVNSLTLDALKSLRIDNLYEIPMLQEVLNFIDKKIFVNIELKGKNTAKPVADLIERYVLEKNWTYNHFLVSSFDWNALQEVRSLSPNIAIGVLTETDLKLAIDFAKFTNAKSVHPYFQLLTMENVKQMHQDGFQVFPWTVNAQEDIHKIKSMKVNGIISDFPDRL